MKVLVVGSLDRSLVNFRGELLKSMVKMGHEVVGCAPAISKEVNSWLAAHGIRCQEINISRTGLNPFADLWTLWNLVRVFRRERPDLILAYTVKPVLYASLASCLVGGARVFSMITGLGYLFTAKRSLKHRVVAAIVNLLYKQALFVNCCIFFQNPDDLAEFWHRKLLSPTVAAVVINGSGVDLQHYAPAPLPKKPKFLLIARLIADKGIREYAEAARVLRSRYPQASFWLVGWLDTNPTAISPEELDVWRQSKVLKYLGALDDIRPVMAECRVYVLPSYREGTPRTVLEAMSMGRPVITTDAPGCREAVVEGKNGFLVPVRDSSALVRAMSRFVEEPKIAEKMGRISRMMAEKRYDVHQVNKSIMGPMGIL